VNPLSFHFGSEIYGEIEEAQDQLLDVVIDNMCDDFSFIEETPQVETETPTETNGATEE